MQDLISVDCENLDAFTYPDDLLLHRNKSHRPFRSARLAIYWCDLGCRGSRGEGFSGYREYKEHVRRVHLDAVAFADKESVQIDEGERQPVSLGRDVASSLLNKTLDDIQPSAIPYALRDESTPSNTIYSGESSEGARMIRDVEIIHDGPGRLSSRARDARSLIGEPQNGKSLLLAPLEDGQHRIIAVDQNLSKKPQLDIRDKSKPQRTSSAAPFPWSLGRSRQKGRTTDKRSGTDHQSSDHGSDPTEFHDRPGTYHSSTETPENLLVRQIGDKLDGSSPLLVAKQADKAAAAMSGQHLTATSQAGEAPILIDESSKEPANAKSPSEQPSKEVKSSRTDWVQPRLVFRFTSVRRCVIAFSRYLYEKILPPSSGEFVTWTCECEQRLSWHRPDLSVSQRKGLAAYFDHPHSGSGRESSPGSQTSINLSSTQTLSPRGITPSTSIGSNESANGDVSIHIEGQDIVECPRRFAPTHEYLELCVTRGGRQKILREIDLKDINSNGELFQAISDAYVEAKLRSYLHPNYLPGRLRGWLDHKLRDWSFMTPNAKSFKKFMLDSSDSIGLCATELPPYEQVKKERNYGYCPFPAKIDEVMPDDIFYHIFNNPAPHSTAKWLPRLPEKLNTSIHDSTESIPVGWGIHIEERPNKHVICLTLLVGLIVSGVFAVPYAIVMKDVQGAFGVAGYIVAVLMTWTTAMFFKWSQD